MKKMFCTFLGLVAMVGCTDNFKRDNPYDPKAPTGIQEPASLCGYVVSSREGAPVSGADVNIVELGRTVTTNDMGIFEFESVPAADWTIEVSVPDGLDSYLPSVRRISLEPGMVIECPPSGQEVPEVQTIVLRRRPDAPRIIDLSADDEGVVLTFSTESKLTSKRYQLHFESVFVGSDEGARPTFEESDVDIVFENDNLTIATLRPFQNGMVEALSPTNTYDLSIRVFDEDLASAYSVPVRYAQRLEFQECRYNDDSTLNNALCAPLDGGIPALQDTKPTEIDVLQGELILVERDDCTVGIWREVGDYLGCVSFSVDLEDGLGERCETVVGEDNVLETSDGVVTWQEISTGNTSTVVVQDWTVDPDTLNPNACVKVTDLAGTEFRRTLLGNPSLQLSAYDDAWVLLYRDSVESALYEDGELVWSRTRDDEVLSENVRNGSYRWIRQFENYTLLNSKVSGKPQTLSLVDTATGETKDTLSFAVDIIGFEMIAPSLFVVVQRNGDLVVVEFLQELEKFRELNVIPSGRQLAANQALWLGHPDSSEVLGYGLLAILDQGNGIISLQALGYRGFTHNGESQWIIEAKDRGLGTNAFQSPLLNSSISELQPIKKVGTMPRLLMRTEPNSGEDVRLGIWGFSP